MGGKFLVFDTVEAANSANDFIFDAGKRLAVDAGLNVSNLGVHGRKAGTSDETTHLTTSWDIVRQRVDGKYVVMHPAHHPDAGQEQVAQILSYLGHPLVEQEAQAWWPQEQEEW